MAVDHNRVLSREPQAGLTNAPRGLEAVDPKWGITVVRVMMGIILIVAGSGKWASGIGGTVAFFTQLGIPLPGVMGPFVALLEVVGGLLLLVGFQTRYVAILFVAEFLVTTFYVKLRGPGWDAGRIDMMILASAVMLLLAGPGRAALDEVWRGRRR